MKCENCGEEMILQHTTERGRHIKEIYRCPLCNLRYRKRIKIIPDTSRDRF